LAAPYRAGLSPATPREFVSSHTADRASLFPMRRRPIFSPSFLVPRRA
jgi:hypothetical protein